MKESKAVRGVSRQSRSTGSLERAHMHYLGRSSRASGSVSLPSIRTGSRASIGRRSRQTLLLPSEFRTPAPGDYNIRSTIGVQAGASFKGDRDRPFGQAKSSNAVFLLPKLVNDSPSPGTYSMRSDIGQGVKSSFGTSPRTARFAGDRTNNAVFLINKYDNPSPGPTRYKIKSTIGDQRGSSPTSGASFSRAKRDSQFSGMNNAKFLLPDKIEKNPAPSFYKTERIGSFGNPKSRGTTFGTARRTARFSGDDRALFLLAETAEDRFRRQYSYRA